MTDMSQLAESHGKTYFFIGNADARILLSGTRVQIPVEVERRITIGKPCRRYFMAVSNHIPTKRQSIARSTTTSAMRSS